MPEIPKDKPRLGRPPSERGRLPIILTLKGTQEWKDWLDAYAVERGITPSELVESALRAMAKRHRREEPPRRV